MPFLTILLSSRILCLTASKSFESASIEGKSSTKSIVGSNIIYLLDWIDNLNDLQCKGVHSDISKQDAMRCIIQTYICLGDILNLQSD